MSYYQLARRVLRFVAVDVVIIVLSKSFKMNIIQHIYAINYCTN